MMIFEFDDAKSQANLLKHGIDFVDAQALWNDPGLLEIPAKTEDEPRYLMIGLINKKHWSAVNYLPRYAYSTDFRSSRTN